MSESNYLFRFYMLKDLFLEMIRGLISYMFQEENFPIVLSINVKIILQILFKMINGRIGKLLLMQKEHFKINLPESMKIHESIFHRQSQLSLIERIVLMTYATHQKWSSS